MTPPEGWRCHDDTWWIKQFRIKEGRWLLAFLNTSEVQDGERPSAWVNIMPDEWLPTTTTYIPAIREVQVPYPARLLEVECIIREWVHEELARTHEATP